MLGKPSPKSTGWAVGFGAILFMTVFCVGMILLALISIVRAEEDIRGVPAFKLGYPSPAMKLGPQFYYLWTDEQCMTLERAVTNPRSVPWKGLLENDALKQKTQQALLEKCEAEKITWVTEHGDVVMHHMHMHLNEQILGGFAVSRYACRQTHDLSVVRWGDQESVTGIDYWGEDDSTDENENLRKFSPETCAYYNGEAQSLLEVMKNPPMRSNGGVTWTSVWYMLEWATTVVLSFK